MIANVSGIRTQLRDFRCCFFFLNFILRIHCKKLEYSSVVNTFAVGPFMIIHICLMSKFG